MYHISNDKRSLESSAWIYDALERLMKAKSFDSITITDVCKEARIGRVTFYRHYDILDDVLQRKSDTMFEAFIPYFIEYKESTKDPGFGLLRPFLRYWYLHPMIIRLAIDANKTDILKKSMDRVIKIGQELPKAKGHIRFDDDPYFSIIRNSVVISILVEWVKNNQNIAPDELVALILTKMKITVNSDQFF